MLKANNLSPKDISIDVNKGLTFEWEAQGEAQTDYRVKVYNNSNDVLVYDSTKITSTDEFNTYIDTTVIAGDEWVQSNNGNDGELAYDIKNIGDGVIIAVKEDAIQRSTNYGKTWSTVKDNYLKYSKIGYDDTNNILIMLAYKSTDKLYVLRSIDSGQTWNSKYIRTSDSDRLLRDCKYIGNNTFICLKDRTSNSHIYRSTDGGINWEITEALDYKALSLYPVNENGTVLLGTDDGYIYKSLNYGQTWTSLGRQTSSASYNIHKFEQITGDIIIALSDETDNSILISDDDGDTWTQIDTSLLTSSYVNDITNIGNGIIFAITYDDSKILKSDDYGLTWSEVSTNLPSFNYGKNIEYGNDTILSIIAQTTSDNDIYYYKIDPTISNGNEYYWNVTTHAGGSSEDSYYEFFKTSSTPNVVFTSPAFGSTPLSSTPVITTQDYTFICDYSQYEDVAIKRFKFILYDNNSNEILNSNWIYDFNISYEITGMENYTYYYIECIVTSQDGLEGTTGKKYFYVLFSPPDNESSLSIVEDNINGNITVDWGDQKYVNGILDGESSSYTTGFYGQAFLIANTDNVLYYVDFNTGYFTIYGRIKPSVGFDGEILTINDTLIFGYDLASTKFYWTDDSETTYSEDTVSLDSTKWYGFGICSGGSETYPVQIAIMLINTNTVTLVATVLVSDDISMF